MTPLYDIMSMQPSYAAKQLRRKEFRLAMAVGDSRDYLVEKILPGHFLQEAKSAGMDQNQVRDLFGDLANSAEGAFERATTNMPDGFPQHIAEPIGAGLRKRSARMSI